MGVKFICSAIKLFNDALSTADKTKRDGETLYKFEVLRLIPRKQVENYSTLIVTRKSLSLFLWKKGKATDIMLSYV